MPESIPPIPEWEPKVGDQVMLDESISDEMKRILAPQFQEGLVYTVLDVIPENEEGPTLLILGPGALRDEDMEAHREGALGVAITHLRPAKLN